MHVLAVTPDVLGTSMAVFDDVNEQEDIPAGFYILARVLTSVHRGLGASVKKSAVLNICPCALTILSLQGWART